MIDSKNLPSGKPYEQLPNLVIIMILSYDPFGAGDLYYEAGTQLKTHPEVPYEDGIRRIYLYADGKYNLAGASGEKLRSMVRYIRYSDKEHVVDEATAELDTIVREARNNKKVSMVYLRTLEREQELKEEGRKEGLEEGTRATESHYKPLLKQKDELIGQKDTEITRLRALLSAHNISET